MGLLHKARQEQPNSPAVYVRHRPETTLLYQIVQEYWPEFQAELASHGRYLPAYVTKEFDEFLKCGRLQYGFLRVRCSEANKARGPLPHDGIRFEGVSFTYAGASQSALMDIDLHIQPGESLALVGENGSGKTTLIKLLTRLYQPDQGRILLDGMDLNDWQESALRQRIGVIFQDFSRYQFLVGENIGVGDVHHFEDAELWREAAGKGMADAFIEGLPAGYSTQLGKWFKDGQELSGGQWQKIALSRAFMRSDADILVLDEPTASMDAAAEAKIFEHFRKLTQNRIAILISHRFSTVRMASQIVVIENGRIIERGSHEDLITLNGHYARLFSLQAAGYK